MPDDSVERTFFHLKFWHSLSLKGNFRESHNPLFIALARTKIWYNLKEVFVHNLKSPNISFGINTFCFLPKYMPCAAAFSVFKI